MLAFAAMMSGREWEARVHREDLAKWPNNGWSLLGLRRALTEQGKTEEAAEVKRQFDEVAQNADFLITSSCICLPAP